jgi:hypothetical protein
MPGCNLAEQGRPYIPASYCPMSCSTSGCCVGFKPNHLNVSSVERQTTGCSRDERQRRLHGESTQRQNCQNRKKVGKVYRRRSPRRRTPRHTALISTTAPACSIALYACINPASVLLYRVPASRPRYKALSSLFTDPAQRFNIYLTYSD